jgi:hypothetical protein
MIHTAVIDEREATADADTLMQYIQPSSLHMQQTTSLVEQQTVGCTKFPVMSI